jgi:hypothetical protein
MKSLFCIVLRVAGCGLELQMAMTSNARVLAAGFSLLAAGQKN